MPPRRPLSATSKPVRRVKISQQPHQVRGTIANGTANRKRRSRAAVNAVLSFEPKNVKRRERRTRQQLQAMAAQIQAHAVLLKVKDMMIDQAAEAMKRSAARAAAAEAKTKRAEADVARLLCEMEETKQHVDSKFEFREASSGYYAFGVDLRLMVMQLVRPAQRSAARCWASLTLSLRRLATVYRYDK